MIVEAVRAAVLAFGLSGTAMAATAPEKGVPVARDGTVDRPSVTSGIGRGSLKAKKLAPVIMDNSQNSTTR
jgi:hypothetical protein